MYELIPIGSSSIATEELVAQSASSGCYAGLASISEQSYVGGREFAFYE